MGLFKRVLNYFFFFVGHFYQSVLHWLCSCGCVCVFFDKVNSDRESGGTGPPQVKGSMGKKFILAVMAYWRVVSRQVVKVKCGQLIIINI